MGKKRMADQIEFVQEEKQKPKLSINKRTVTEIEKQGHREKLEEASKIAEDMETLNENATAVNTAVQEDQENFDKTTKAVNQTEVQVDMATEDLEKAQDK